MTESASLPLSELLCCMLAVLRRQALLGHVGHNGQPLRRPDLMAGGLLLGPWGENF